MSSKARLARSYRPITSPTPALAGLVVGVVALGSAWHARADDHVVIYGGGQYDAASYGSAGFAAALPGSSIGHGFAIQASGAGGSYSYDSNTTRHRATFGGGELAGLYEYSQGGFWINGGVAVRYDSTSISPTDPSNRRQGAQWQAALIVEGGEVVGPWRTDWYGAYGTRLQDYQVRASLSHVVSGPVRLGAEVGAEGDPTYNLQRIGPYGAVSVGRNAEVQISAGLSERSYRDPGAYLRVGFYEAF